MAAAASLRLIEESFAQQVDGALDHLEQRVKEAMVEAGEELLELVSHLMLLLLHAPLQLLRVVRSVRVVVG